MRFIFTPAAERALEQASGWTLGSERHELEAESLLLGLLSEPECRAAVMLARVGVDISVVRKRWAELAHSIPPKDGAIARKPLSSDVVCSLQLASGRLELLPRPIEFATEHILLGLASADHEVSLWLRRQGLDPDSLAAEIRKLHGFSAEDDPLKALDVPDESIDIWESNSDNNSRGLTAPGEGTDNSDIVVQASRLHGAAGTAAPQSAMIDALRVIDAAANRAREGIRVVEDYVRLILDDRHLTRLCKQLRHDLTECLGSIAPQRRFSARETLADVGTDLDTTSEGRRASPLEVMRANFARLQEALRSLEEFGKLLDADCWGDSWTATPGATEQLSPQPANLAAAVKQLRYRAYTLQRAVEIAARSIERLASARLYVLLDGGPSPEEFERLAASLIAAGAGVLQLRDKRLGDRELLARARLLRAITKEHVAQPPSAVTDNDYGTAEGGTAEGGCATNRRVLFIVNDRPDLAALAGADGVHVGQEEVSVKDARRIVGPDALVGVSAHSIEQARQAVLDGADYIGVGPVFASETKRFEHFPGVELVRAVSAEIRLPAFAIGGIDRSNVAQVLAAGATRIAVGSAITAADDPARAARELASTVIRSVQT